MEEVKEVKIVMDEYGILYAVIPDGTIRKICADVYGNPYYGRVRVLSEAEEAE